MTRPARRRLPRLLTGLLVLLLILLVLDRGGRWLAQREVAGRIQTAQHLPHRPSVSIAGFPFLTQVIGSRYQRVDLAANDVTVGDPGRTVTVTALAVRLDTVRTARDFSSATADRLSGSATLSYAELSRVLGESLSYGGTAGDGRGRVTASRSVTALGQTASGSVSAVVSVSGSDQLTFSDARVTIAQAGVSVPQAITDQFTSLFARPLSLRGLPLGLRIGSITARPDGVTITASAANVALG